MRMQNYPALAPFVEQNSQHMNRVSTSPKIWMGRDDSIEGTIVV